MRFLLLSHLLYGIGMKIIIMNRSISVYTEKRQRGQLIKSRFEVMKNKLYVKIAR